MRRIVGFLALLASLIACQPAAAHTRSETHSNWVITGSVVRLAFTMPELEAKRLEAAGYATPGQISAYLAKRLSASAAGVPCPADAPPQAVAAAPGYLRFEQSFRCASDTDLRLHSAAFFDLVPSHTNFAQIHTRDGAFIEQLITKDHQTLSVGAPGASEMENASFFDYIAHGVMHIFTGIDHQLFLVGLVLLSRRLKDLLFVISGFTLGHSLTLALAVTGVLRPHAEYIDSLIGLTIALVGLECVAERTRKAGAIALGIGGLLFLMAAASFAGWASLPVLLLIGGGVFAANYLLVAAHIGDAGRLRLAVTLIFGLIHGFGFAADLLEMKLPVNRLAELLVGFNLGAELGQVTLVLIVIGVLQALKRTPLAQFQAISGEMAASFLVAIGLYWFVSRGYAVGGGHLG